MKKVLFVNMDILLKMVHVLNVQKHIEIYCNTSCATLSIRSDDNFLINFDKYEVFFPFDRIFILSQ